MYTILFSKQAMKDRRLLAQAHLEIRTKMLLSVMMEDPFQNPPPYEKLIGDLRGFYSRRINAQHRLVYSVNTANRTVKVLRMWSHYE